MQEMQVQSLGQEDPLEKGMTTHYIILGQRSLEGYTPWGRRVRHELATCHCSLTKLCPTLCSPMKCSMSGSLVFHYLPEFAQTHVHWVADTIQPFHPLPPPSPFAFSLSQCQSLFQWVSSSHQVAKVLDLQLQHQSFQWYSRLMSRKTDWFDILAVQESVKSLLQHHSLKASILWCSAFFMVQLSHLYITTGKSYVTAI